MIDLNKLRLGRGGMAPTHTDLSRPFWAPRSLMAKAQIVAGLGIGVVGFRGPDLVWSHAYEPGLGGRRLVGLSSACVCACVFEDQHISTTIPVYRYIDR